MTSNADRLEFAPPRDKGSPRAFGLALGVHVLLIAALTWGVNWKRTDDAASFEAEVWAGVPQPAAPREIQKPPPLSAPTPPPAPDPIPPPLAKAPEIRETPPVADMDIALEKEKKRKLLQQQKETDVLKAQKLLEKREAELQARQVKEQERKREQEKQAREDLAERKARDAANEKEKRTAAANAAAVEKQKQAAAEKQKAAAAATAAANAEKQREAVAAATAAKQKAVAEGAEKARQAANQKRIMDMAASAGGADGPSGSGSARASGPSAGYAGKVKARVLPNVVFNDDIAGNPKAEVEVTTTLDGTIMSQRLLKSSGNKAWDDAVIKAIVRTGSLPRDVDGRVPTPMIIEFRPN